MPPSRNGGTSFTIYAHEEEKRNLPFTGLSDTTIYMKKYILWALISLIFITGRVFAQGPTWPKDITLVVQAPSQYENGDPILSTDGLGIDGTCYNQSSGEVVIDQSPFVGTILPGTQVSMVYTGVIPNAGTYECYTNAYVAIEGSSRSENSNVATRRYVGRVSPPIIVVFDE